MTPSSLAIAVVSKKKLNNLFMYFLTIRQLKFRASNSFMIKCPVYLLQHAHPFLSAMVNNGTLHYDHDRDGTHTQIAGCETNFRGIKDETYIAIRYEDNILTVSGLTNKPKILKLHDTHWHYATNTLYKTGKKITYLQLFTHVANTLFHKIDSFRKIKIIFVK